ncbi:MAG TPA: hypothetical protein VM369_10030 [Candidatus Binatia bacterium]|nr:hypothetical protein [Candidatus Binatia bacterium]
MQQKGTLRLALLVAMALCATLYWPALHGPLVLDDFPQIAPLLDEEREVDTGRELFSSSGVTGRPLSMATFLLDRAVHGSDLAGWKLTNLLLHLACGALVFGLAGALARAAGIALPQGLALAVAAIWLLHPLQVSTVLYTVQRMTQLAAAFSLAGMWAYTAGRTRQLAGLPGAPARLGLAAACVPLAILAKENGALLPLYLLLVEALLFRFSGDGIARRRLGIAGIALLLVIAAAMAWALAHLLPMMRAGYAASDFTPATRLLTEQRVVASYLGQIFAPWPGRMGFYHDDVPMSAGWLQPASTLVAALLLAALAAAAFWLRRRLPLASLGILLFFAGHAIESTLWPLLPMFEHRNYFPLFGAVLAAAALLHRLLASPARRVAVAATCVAACAALTAVHAHAWRSREALTGYVLRVHPSSAWAIADASQLMTEQQRYGEAAALLRTSPRGEAELQAAYVQCLASGSVGAQDLARAGERLPARIGTYALSGLIELAALAVDRRCSMLTPALLALYDAALARPIRDSSGRGRLLLWKAQLQRAGGDTPGAIATLEIAARAQASWPVPLYLEAQWHADDGEAGAALASLARAEAAAGAAAGEYADLAGDVRAALARTPPQRAR